MSQNKIMTMVLRDNDDHSRAIRILQTRMFFLLFVAVVLSPSYVVLIKRSPSKLSFFPLSSAAYHP